MSSFYLNSLKVNGHRIVTAESDEILKSKEEDDLFYEIELLFKFVLVDGDREAGYKWELM